MLLFLVEYLQTLSAVPLGLGVKHCQSKQPYRLLISQSSRAQRDCAESTGPEGLTICI